METNTTEFREEYRHLNDLKREISIEIDSYSQKECGLAPDIKGNLDYEAVSAWKVETDQKDRYKQVVEEYREQLKNPYSARIDLINADTGVCEKYYIGKSAIILDNMKAKVVSWYTEFGDFCKAGRVEGKIYNTNYRLDMRRNIHIDNGKLKEVQTDFQSGSEILGKDVVDHFLLMVLKDKRRSSQLTDIIATINQKQNEIMRLPENMDFVLQGCAGSGKTMVLLHRLSILLFHRKWTGMQKFRIITPNENFNLFVKDLSESLDLRGIPLRSAGSYYLDLISSYGITVNRNARILHEKELDPETLSRLYSEEFQQEILDSLQRIWTSANSKLSSLDFFNVARLHGIDLNNIDKPGLKAYDKLSDALGSLTKLIEELLKWETEVTTKLNADLKKKGTLSVELEEKKLNLAARKIVQHIHEAENKIEAEQISFLEEQEKLFPNEKLIIDDDSDIYKRLSRIGFSKAFREITTVFMTGDLDDLTELTQSIVQIRDCFIGYVSPRIKKDETIKKDQYHGSSWLLLSVVRLQQEFDEIITLQNNLIKLCTLFEDQNDQPLPGGLRAFQNIPSVREYISKKENLLWIREKLGSIPMEVENCRQELAEIQKEKERLRIDQQFLKSAGSIIESLSFRRICDAAVKRPVRKLLNIREKKDEYYQVELYLWLYCCSLYFPNVDHEEKLVSVDEAQDLSACELQTLKCVLGPKCHFNLYGDINQLVYSYKGICDWKKCSLTADLPVYELNQNYRNTNQVTEFCNHSLGMNMQSIGIEGKEVQIIPETQLRLALTKFTPSKNRSFAVIYSKEHDEVPVLLTNILGHRNVVIGGLYPKKVSVLTVEEAKGLEFYSVLVFPEGMSNNELYVAFTRALHELTVIT